MSEAPRLSVVIPCHNPHGGRLRRVLEGLRAQTLPAGLWEVVVIDNASTPPLPTDLGTDLLPAVPRRVVVESRAGLTRARLAGIAASRGGVLVFVDDDNVLAPDFLATVLAAFDANPRLTAAGGAIAAEYEVPPPAWAREFEPLLAIRDFGPEPRIARGGGTAPWPDFAPVGAGLCVRREAAESYDRALQADPRRIALDRRAGELVSGGDNDMVFSALRAGGEVAYLPELRLTHLIPSGRFERGYLARLNRAIQRSWVRVLALHGERPWPGIPRRTLPLRLAKAWWRSRPWRGPAETVRYHGLAGRLEGQADLGTA